jgi:type IX secretion system PorP/SprF family membrane protein
MKKISYIICICLLPQCLWAQDFVFSQFYESPLLRNPALAGIMQGNLRIVSAYRSQWSSVTVPYETQALSAEVRLPLNLTGDYLTTSLQLTKDVAGDSKLGRTQLLPAITFHKALSDAQGESANYLNFSVMGGLVQSSFDPTKMTFDDQFVGGSFNPGNITTAVFSRTSMTYGDLSAGLSFSSNNAGTIKYYAGIAGYHLVRSKVSFYKNDVAILKPRYVLNAGMNMQTGENDRFYVYGDLNMQGGNRQLMLGILYKFNIGQYENDDEEIGSKSVSFGASYRWGDALIPVGKIYFSKFFAGVSYDVNVSKLRSASQFRGGLEVSAGYITNLNILKVPNQICPGF